MVLCSPSLTCLPTQATVQPVTLLAASLPQSPSMPCSLILPANKATFNCSTLSPLSPISSLPPPLTASSPTNAFSFQNPLTLSPFNAYNSSVMLQPSAWKQSYGMEHVWLSEFHRLFSNYFQQVWLLQAVDYRPITNNSMHTFVDSAKVRFCCDKCGHGWTSMKGRVAFWFDLLPPYYTYGFVAFKLYGQQCEKCKSDRYEHAMWYPEEVCKVLTNLYNKVGQLYYGFYQPPIEKARRSGKPRTPHNSDLCQACKDGLCADRK